MSKSYKIFVQKEIIAILEDACDDDVLQETMYGLDNEGIYYGWTNGEAYEILEPLQKAGVNIDSIEQVDIVFRALCNKFDY